MASSDCNRFLARSVTAGLVWYIVVVGWFLVVWMEGMLEPIIRLFETRLGSRYYGLDVSPLVRFLPLLVGWFPIVFFVTLLVAMVIETRPPLAMRRVLLCFAIVWGWLLSTILWICAFPNGFFVYAPAAIGYVLGILGYLVLEWLAFATGQRSDDSR